MNVIEDALKATRTLHRILILAGLAGLVFVLSLEYPRRALALRDQITRLAALPFHTYDQYVNDRINEVLGDDLSATVTACEEALAQAPPEQARRVCDAFSTPAEVVRIRSDALPTADVLEVCLHELDALGDHDAIHTDVEAIIAVPGARMQTVSDALSEYGTGQVESVQLGILDSSTPTALLSFEIHREERAAPVIEQRLLARGVRVPRSAWHTWLRTQAKDLVSADGGLTWLPEADDAERTIPLKELREQLQDRIDTTRMQNRTIELPGITIPGSMTLLALPIALIGIALSLAAHLDHLNALAPQHTTKLREFAWLPLTGSAWWFDAAWSVIAVPGAVMLALILKSRGFPSRWITVVVALLGLAAVVLVGSMIMQRLARLRRQIN